MKFETIITEIRSFGDKQVDCKHFIIRSTERYCLKNEESIQLIKDSGIELNKSQEAKSRKRDASHLLKTLRSGEGISEAFSQLPEKLGSIYPLSE